MAWRDSWGYVTPRPSQVLSTRVPGCPQVETCYTRSAAQQGVDREKPVLFLKLMQSRGWMGVEGSLPTIRGPCAPNQMADSLRIRGQLRIAVASVELEARYYHWTADSLQRAWLILSSMQLYRSANRQAILASEDSKH